MPKSISTAASPERNAVLNRERQIFKRENLQASTDELDLKEDHRRRSANKQHADFGMARRTLRMGMRLMRDNESYVPPELRHGATLKELQEYYRTFSPKLLDKWVKAGAAHTAFHDDNPLGQWRKRIEELYEIELPLPSKK